MPIVIGLVRAQGGAAVVATLLPGLCGLAALLTTLQHRRLAPFLLFVYSAFWLVILVGGLFAQVLSAKFTGLARISSWSWLVGGTTLVVMLVAFLLLAIWSIGQWRGETAAGRRP